MNLCLGREDKPSKLQSGQNILPPKNKQTYIKIQEFRWGITWNHPKRPLTQVCESSLPKFSPQTVLIENICKNRGQQGKTIPIPDGFYAGMDNFPSSRDTCTILTLYSYIGLQVYTYIDLSKHVISLIVCGTATDHQSSGLGRLLQSSRFILIVKSTTNKYRPDLTIITKNHDLFIQRLFHGYL